MRKQKLKKTEGGTYVLRMTRAEYLGLVQLTCCNVTGSTVSRLGLDGVVQAIGGDNAAFRTEYNEATTDSARVSKDVIGRTV